jgi:geranylgeranyl pyrophosphate synthase
MLLHFMRGAAGSLIERATRLLQTPRRQKRQADVDWLLDAMREAGSIEHGRRLAVEYCERALDLDAEGLSYLEDNDDRRFLREMLRYVIERVK